jgi:hypothetical protein
VEKPSDSVTMASHYAFDASLFAMVATSTVDEDAIMPSRK